MEKVPTSIQIDRTKKKEAVKRLKTLGLKLQDVVDRFWDFLILAKSDEVYDFMSEHTKETIKMIIFMTTIAIASGLLFSNRNAVIALLGW